ncbi:MAG: PKD domain-containing protein, partial [Bacteroidota bacterium]
ANAGLDQTIEDSDRSGSEQVTLDGSASSDDIGITSYSWSWSGGSATGVNPTVDLPVGITTITLTVTDAESETATDEVIITVNEPANQPPVANAGGDITVEDGDRNGSETVTLDGSASTDPESQPLTYDWMWAGGGSATGEITNADFPVGTTTVTLTVTDDQGEAANDEVVITVNIPANQLPVANAGSDQTITDSDGNGSEEVSLDGSASVDNDGSIVSYAWTWPGGGSASGVNPATTLPVGSTTVILTVTDDVGAAASDEVVITINEAEAPTFTLTNSDVLENEEVNTLVGRIETESPINLTYSLPNGQVNNQSFNIINGNELVTNEVFDREGQATYTVQVRATYPTGSVDQNFEITILNKLEPPTNITLDNTDIDENLANALVGNLAAAGGAAPFTFSLTGSNNDNSLFTVDGIQLKTKDGLNFEAKSSFEIEITVASADGNFTKKFTITVNDLDEPPTDIFLSSTSVNENEPRNTLVGTLSAEGGSIESPTFRLVGSGNDNSQFRINGNELRTNAVFDR